MDVLSRHDPGGLGESLLSSDLTAETSSSSSSRRPSLRHSMTMAAGMESAMAWKRRLKEDLHHGLHEAQEAFLEKTLKRQSFYVNDATAGIRPPLPAASPGASPRPLCRSSEEPASSPAGRSAARAAPSAAASRACSAAVQAAGEQVPSVAGRCRAKSDEDIGGCRRSSKLFRKLRNTLAPNRGAYMDTDWFKIYEKKHRIAWLFLAQHLYYWYYAGYIIFVILLGGTLICATEPDGGLDFWQSLYTAASCVSQSGLAVADWSQRARSTYIISFCLILMGSASLLSCVPVLLRESSFRAQARLTRRMQLRSESFNTESFPPSPSGAGIPAMPFRRVFSDPCVGGDDGRATPSSAARRGALRDIQMMMLPEGRAAAGLQPSLFGAYDVEPGIFAMLKGSSRSGPKICCSALLPVKYRLEYKALRIVLKVVLGYWLACHLLGFTVFFVYFRFSDGAIQEKFRSEGLDPMWHALYLTVSAFQNNGLVMTPSSVMDFASSPILLNTIGLLIFFGNTGLPIMVRLVVSLWEKHSAPLSERQKILDFLLEHPRRCFTHMFPAAHTLWLLLVFVGLNVMTTLVIMYQDSTGPAMRSLGEVDRWWNALFQSVSTRTAGLNSMNIAYLSQGTTFFLCVMMYFSTTPTVVTMRLSAVTGKSAELDITGRSEGVAEEDVLDVDNSVKSQARRYLSQDVVWLTLAIFFICCFEQHQFAKSAKDISPDSDGIYGDFTFFKVLFEIASAYGTCGLSLGFQNQTTSFSSVWSRQSQVVLVLVMILGRLRGLPDSIDPSVRYAMQQHNDREAEEEHCFVHT